MSSSRHSDGDDADCAGGGGGGGGDFTFSSGDGGNGGYGGGGGGGAWDDGDGGLGGFGGGGGGATVQIVDGCGYCGGTGGGGGFGGGGGNGPGGFIFGSTGAGGTFGGHGSELNGGGGAGLGGAIFGHSSTITVSNSTFTGNFAVRGVAGTSGFEEDQAAMNGSDAGGAIFTVGGALTITNSTIAGNESTGDGAGVVTYKPESGEATSLVLQNTIVAGNSGRDECFVLGGVATSGTSNLVTPHPTDARTACPAITQTDDPLLGALALNEPGRTPTMAIDATSPAFNTGEADVAPTDDQRGVSRPRFGAVDIGAYEFIGSPDTTAPQSAPTLASGSSLDGWNTTDVTIDWGWADVGGSGVDPDACTLETTSTGEGSALLLTATCTDLAGNTSTASYTVKVDKTGPVVTCAASPTYVIGSTPTSGLSATVTDALSGPVTSPVTAAVTAGDVDAVGRLHQATHGHGCRGQHHDRELRVRRGVRLPRVPAADPAVVVQARLDDPGAVPARRRGRSAERCEGRGAALAEMPGLRVARRAGRGVREVHREDRHVPVRREDDEGARRGHPLDRDHREVDRRCRRQQQLDAGVAPVGATASTHAEVGRLCQVSKATAAAPSTSPAAHRRMNSS